MNDDVYELIVCTVCTTHSPDIEEPGGPVWHWMHLDIDRIGAFCSNACADEWVTAKGGKR